MDEIRVDKPDLATLEQDGILSWPIWKKEASVFDWHYDERETCYVLEGRVRVVPRDGRAPVEFGRGDRVVFPEGLSCTWHVIEDVKKHFQFG